MEGVWDVSAPEGPQGPWVAERTTCDLLSESATRVKVDRSESARVEKQSWATHR